MAETMAAPWATQVIGSTRSNGSGSLPASFSVTKRRTSGILLVPPTSSTLSMSLGRRPRSFSASSMAVPDFTTSGMITRSNVGAVDLLFQAQVPLGHQLGLAGDGRLLASDRSILAFSTASMNCCL